MNQYNEMYFRMCELLDTCTGHVCCNNWVCDVSWTLGWAERSGLRFFWTKLVDILGGFLLVEMILWDPRCRLLVHVDVHEGDLLPGL